jgi:hypothetical protein
MHAANIGQKLRDRVFAHARHATNRTNCHALAEQLKDLGAIGSGELFHAEHGMTIHA